MATFKIMVGNETLVGTAVNVAQSYFYTIVVGIVILLAGFGLGILSKKLVYRILKELELNHMMNKVGMTHDFEKIISNVVSWVIYLVFIVIFLNHLGITSVVLYLILGAILILIILTFLVGLKDVIPNFVGWIYLQRGNKVVVDKIIEVKEIYGTVERIGYLETEIRTESGDVLYVPNSLFLKSKYKVKK